MRNTKLDFLCVFIPIFLYVLFNAFARWYHWSIFVGDYRWGELGILQISLIITNISLQYFLIFFLIYKILSHYFIKIFPISYLMLVWLFLLYIESDLSWYALSKNHINLADMLALITEDWQNHFGFNTGQIWMKIKPGLMHSMVIVFAFLFIKICYRFIAQNKMKSSNPDFNYTIIVTVLFCSLVTIFTTSFWGARMSPEQWQSTFNKNIFRDWSLNKLFLDNKYADIKKHYSDKFINDKKYTIEQLNTKILQPISNRKDVLIIAVEGFNDSFMDENTTPYFYSLSKKGLYYQNHFSTGNSTSNGVLGLLFGMPTFFYNRSEIQSRYIDLFNREGYETKWYGKKVLEHNMEVYFDSFQIKPETNLSSSEVLSDVHSTLSSSDQNMVFLYYRETHWPYLHHSDFGKFTPTVPDNFTFSDSELHLFRAEIINKYRNSLLEFDHWLKQLMSEVDLNNTIVLIVGDHGEEMFETGRLSHSSTLNGPMTKTPALILSPNIKPRIINSITSHANLFPTIVNLLGINTTDERQFIFPAVRENKIGNIAFSAKNSQAFAANDWVLISEKHKVFVKINDEELDVVKITSLTDEDLSSPLTEISTSDSLMDGLKMLDDLTK